MTQSKNKLREHGVATTRQRMLILKSMQERKDHPDAEAVLASLKGGVPLLSLDTVYRTLKLFTRVGLIQQLSVPTRRFRFDGCVAAHDHFICTQCEFIADLVTSDDLPERIPGAVREFGEISRVQRVYVGRCIRCISENAEVVVSH